MAVYDCDLILKIEGKPDTTFSCCCPDEACFLDCKDALNAAMVAIDDFRRANPHDVACAAKGHKGACVNLKITVTRDDAPHVGPTDFPLHDVPAAAVKEMEKEWKKFLATPCVASCAKP